MMDCISSFLAAIFLTSYQRNKMPFLPLFKNQKTLFSLVFKVNMEKLPSLHQSMEDHSVMPLAVTFMSENIFSEFLSKKADSQDILKQTCE